MGNDDYLLGQIADLEALLEEAIARGDTQNAESLRNEIRGSTGSAKNGRVDRTNSKWNHRATFVVEATWSGLVPVRTGRATSRIRGARKNSQGSILGMNGQRFTCLGVVDLSEPVWWTAVISVG